MPESLRTAVRWCFSTLVLLSDPENTGKVAGALTSCLLRKRLGYQTAASRCSCVIQPSLPTFRMNWTPVFGFQHIEDLLWVHVPLARLPPSLPHKQQKSVTQAFPHLCIFTHAGHSTQQSSRISLLMGTTEPLKHFNDTCSTKAFLPRSQQRTAPCCTLCSPNV